MKTKGFIFLGMSIISIALLASCTTFKADGLAFITQNDNTENLGRFTVSKTVHELFGTPAGSNFLNITATTMSDKVSGIIWKEIQKKGGNGATNISITYSAGPLAYFANWITFGIWAPAKLKITGDVIKVHSATVKKDTNIAIDKAVTNAVNQ